MPPKPKSKQVKLKRQYLEPWQSTILFRFRRDGMSTLTPDLLQECHMESNVSIKRIKRWTLNQNTGNRKPPKAISSDITTWHTFAADYQKVDPFNGDKDKLGQQSKDRSKAYKAAMKSKKKRADLIKRTEERKRTPVEEMTPQQRKHAIKKIHSEIEKKCKKLKVYGFETATLTFAADHAPAVDGSAHVANFLMYEANAMLLKCHENLFGNIDPKLLKTESLVANIRSRFNYLHGQALGLDTTVPLPYGDIEDGKSPVIVKGLPESIEVKSPDRYKRHELIQIYLGLSSLSVEIQTRRNSAKDNDSVRQSEEAIAESGSDGNSEEVIDQGTGDDPSQMITNDMGSAPTARVILEVLANGGTLTEVDLNASETDSITAERTHQVEIEHIFPTFLDEENEGESHVKKKSQRKRRGVPLTEKNSSTEKRKKDEGVRKRRETLMNVKGKKATVSKPKGGENVMPRRKKMQHAEENQRPRRTARHS